MQITIPASVEAVESYVFSGCTSLQRVTFGEGVNSIGYHVFDGCAALTSVIFVNTLGWSVSTSSSMKDAVEVDAILLSSSSIAAEKMSVEYIEYFWKRTVTE
jgi:hypothetical protein